MYIADIDPELKLDIYHLYFEALRAAHTGQAMDLYGLDYLMDDVVEQGKETAGSAREGYSSTKICCTSLLSCSNWGYARWRK